MKSGRAVRPRGPGVQLLRRRHFLFAGAILGGGLLAAPALARQVCRPTEGDIFESYYGFDAPFLTKLAGPPEEPGERLVISGTMLSADCRTPIPGIWVEVWQANSTGLYDTQRRGNITDKGSSTSTPTLRTVAASRR